MFGEPKRVSPAMLASSFDRRALVIGGLQAGIGVLLAVRMGWIAIFQNRKYELASESNRVNLSLIPPRRGWILDRNGAPLASNRSDFRVDIIPDRLVDTDATLSTLGQLLQLTAVQLRDIRDRLEKARGFQPVEVAAGLDWERFAAVSVRLPDLPGVIPQRGYSRHYPTGPSIGHLIGYVGTASAEDYARDRNPLMLTPGFKVGKDGVEKQFEARLRGQPGARRTEVTASGRIVRDLETRDDVPGKPLQLTIDGPLQDYAARRLGPESGSVVVMDCNNGDILCAASMPSFDPNSFSDGIGRVEWKMLSDDDHVPLRNKVLRGLYPPGSTVKPFVALAFLEAGISPDETVGCSGGLRVGNRVFHCWNRRGHGRVDMAKAIYQSCDVYFYHLAQRVGMDRIAAMARRVGLGQKFDLPVASQSYGTVPDPEWKKRKYDRDWAVFDTVNATIGQGYMLVNPLQQAVMASRVASGRLVLPRLLLDKKVPDFPSLGFSQEHLDYIHQAMSDVVNGPGTAPRAKLPIPGLNLAGKTGTAQVVSLSVSDGKSGPWKYRDHGHFICHVPFDKPRYACAVVIEHGGGSASAYPVARDVMTYLYDPAKAMEVLKPMEAAWGGTPQQRLASKYAVYSARYGTSAPRVAESPDAEVHRSESGGSGSPAQPMERNAASPAAEPVGPAPEPTASPAAPVATVAPAGDAGP